MVLYESHARDISTRDHYNIVTPPSLDVLIRVIRNIAYDKDSLPQETLDLANKFRTSLFPWRGQFSPELVAIFLNRYGQKNSVVLDPFLGSGTTLFESIRKDLTCYGAEINPSAIEMARTAEFSNIDIEKRKDAIREATLLAERFFKRRSYDLFSYLEEQDTSPDRTLEDSFKAILQEATGKPFVYNIIINAIIRFMNYKEPRVKPDFLKALREHTKIIEQIPYIAKECKVFHTDARSIPLPDKSVDLVISSPPYINVFNYHQNNRAAMELVGWDLLDIAKSEIGSNRKNRQNRFFTVVQYALDMLDSLHEIRRLLRPNGRAILVVGKESNVRRAHFNNGFLVIMLALGGAGFTLETLQERKFVNKFGEIIHEDILHLRPDSNAKVADHELARSAAIWHLQQHINVVDEQVKSEIAEAIERAKTIQKSPIFTIDAYHKDSNVSKKDSAKEVSMPKRKNN